MDFNFFLRLKNFRFTRYLSEFLSIILSLILIFCIYYKFSYLSSDFFVKFLTISYHLPFLVILVLLFLFFRYILDRCQIDNFFVFKRKKFYSFKKPKPNWPKDWIFQGAAYAELKPASLSITSSNSGCLLDRYVWKNFEINFEVKIDKDAVGILFRGQDLENYFMLQLRLRPTCYFRKLEIVPHVRIYGNWEVISGVTLNREIYLPYSNSFLKVKLRVIDKVASLFIDNDSKSIYDWILPTHSDVNIIQHSDSNSDKDIKDTRLVPQIFFRNKYGQIGFRAYGGEKATIENLQIIKILETKMILPVLGIPTINI